MIHQFHVLFNHAPLPHDPAAAAALLTQRANHFQAQVAGGALVGDNLGAALSAAREDALYSQLQILLLGVPGLALAAVVASLVVALRGERRRREVALLQLRGARPAQLLRIVAGETALTGALGVLLGVPLAALAARLALPASASALLPVYDGLVRLRRTDGASGLVLVPDLATALPRPTDGGRTYTFRLRAGVRYSTGAAVRPADIRRGLERQFTAGGAAPTYYAGIVGGLPASSVRPAATFPGASSPTMQPPR